MPCAMARTTSSSPGCTSRSWVIVRRLNCSRGVSSHARSFMGRLSARSSRLGSAKGALSSATMSPSVSCFSPMSPRISSAYASRSSSSSSPSFSGRITSCSLARSRSASSCSPPSSAASSRASTAIFLASVYDSGWIRVPSAGPPPASITLSSSSTSCPTSSLVFHWLELVVMRRKPTALVHTTLRIPVARTVASWRSCMRYCTHPVCFSTWSSSPALRGPRPLTNWRVLPCIGCRSTARLMSTPTSLTTVTKARWRKRRRSPRSRACWRGCSWRLSTSSDCPTHMPAISRRGSWRRLARETAARRVGGNLGNSCAARSECAYRCATHSSA
mmetsp:Transcript_45273/g.94823  ORF Transcript_45273/g.94823 Transcript_45273/m.94823 type:complete len:331 (-) Transcript_45273:2959-3951(-)